MRLYRLLLGLCPAPFRDDYADGMEETFARRLADARRAGRWRCLGVWLREVLGLLVVVAPNGGTQYARAASRRTPNGGRDVWIASVRNFATRHGD
jgi:hypothetical protein